MPVSAETAARSDAPSTVRMTYTHREFSANQVRQTPIIEDQRLNQGPSDQPQSSQMPSDTVEPTTVSARGREGTEIKVQPFGLIGSRYDETRCVFEISCIFADIDIVFQTWR